MSHYKDVLSLVHRIINLLGLELKVCIDVLSVGIIKLIVPMMGCRYGDSITHDAATDVIVKSDIFGT